MFRALVVLAALSFAVVSSHENPDCDIEPEHRVDAWDGEFDLHGCEERGYCWSESPSHNPGPSCFHHAEVEGHASEGECDAARQQERRDCLPGGGDAHDCGASRACSSPRPRAPPPLARDRPPPRARPPTHTLQSTRAAAGRPARTTRIRIVITRLVRASRPSCEAQQKRNKARGVVGGSKLHGEGGGG